MPWRPRTGRRPKGMLNEPDVRDVEVFIYGLVDPRTGFVRYVGKSSKPRYRLTHHLSQDAPVRMFLWCRELERDGQRPMLVILRVVPPGADARAAEVSELERAADAGWPLLNYHGFRNRGRLPNPLEDMDQLRELVAGGHKYYVARGTWLLERAARKAS